MHTSLGRLPLFYIYHPSAVVCTTMIKLHFSPYVVRVSQRESAVSFSSLFLRSYARSFACVNGRKEEKRRRKKYIFIHHCALHTYNSFGRKTRRESCLLFFLLLSSFFPFLHRVVWVDVMLQGSEKC